MLSIQKQNKISQFFLNKPVQRAYLFGSFARNEESAESDIDILVDLDYQNGADFFMFLDMQEQLSKILKKSVDFLVQMDFRST